MLDCGADTVPYCSCFLDTLIGMQNMHVGHGVVFKSGASVSLSSGGAILPAADRLEDASSVQVGVCDSEYK